MPSNRYRSTAFTRRPSLMVLAAREFCVTNNRPDLAEAIGTSRTGVPTVPGGLTNSERPLDDALLLLRALRVGHLQPGGTPELVGSDEELTNMWAKDQAKNDA